MTLKSSIQSFVATAMPGALQVAKDDKVAELINQNACYLDAASALCVKACNATLAQIGTSTLPTKVSGAAFTLAQQLRELLDKGVLSGVRLHDSGTAISLSSDGS